MSVIDEVKTVCDRLAPHGWAQVLAQHELDITSADLKGELDRDLPHIDRHAAGFEDFALEGKKGIEPGHPARSLLYHALASTNVTRKVDGSLLSTFPTLAEIETVENYVFGARRPGFSVTREPGSSGTATSISSPLAKTKMARGAVFRSGAPTLRLSSSIARSRWE